MGKVWSLDFLGVVIVYNPCSYGSLLITGEGGPTCFFVRDISVFFLQILTCCKRFF